VFKRPIEMSLSAVKLGYTGDGNVLAHGDVSRRADQTQCSAPASTCFPKNARLTRVRATCVAHWRAGPSTCGRPRVRVLS
jgi:hypothetical protein